MLEDYPNLLTKSQNSYKYNKKRYSRRTKPYGNFMLKESLP